MILSNRAAFLKGVVKLRVWFLFSAGLAFSFLTGFEGVTGIAFLLLAFPDLPARRICSQSVPL